MSEEWKVLRKKKDTSGEVSVKIIQKVWVQKGGFFLPCGGLSGSTL